MIHQFLNYLKKDFTNIDEVYTKLLNKYNPDNINRTELMFIDSINFDNIEYSENVPKLSMYLGQKKTVINWQNIDYYNHYLKRDKTKPYKHFSMYHALQSDKPFIGKNIAYNDFINKLITIKSRYDFVYSKLNDTDKKELKLDFIDQLNQYKNNQVHTKFKDAISNLIDSIEKPQQIETGKPDEVKKEFKAFFKSDVNFNVIESIKTEFKDYEGKKMAILIYLLENEFKLISYSLDSKTDSRKHLVDSLNNSKPNMQPINKCFVTHSYELDITKLEKDKDYINIKEKLLKTIQ